MSHLIRSPNDLDFSKIESLLTRAAFFNSKPFTPKESRVRDRIAVLAFFEPSTRTRTSFEVACHRLGVRPAPFVESASSMLKGESVYETLKTIQMMRPDLIITRTTEKFDDVWPQSDIAAINGGDGTFHHPTQALTDLFTLRRHWKELKNKKLLFVGDIKHSRVAHSNFDLLKNFGCEFGLVGPESWIQGAKDSVKITETFSDFHSALKWADAVFLHRLQFERHHEKTSAPQKFEFQFNSESLKVISPQTLVLHPGPFNLGVEITNEVIKDSRVMIHAQVAHSIPVRMALIEQVLGGTI